MKKAPSALRAGTEEMNVDPEKKRKRIEDAQEMIGWAYSELRWFSEEEAKQAEQQRKDLLDALSGWITHSFHGYKLHSGPLSPGCLLCARGGWGCNYINHLCTRRCFYCPQERQLEVEQPSKTDELAFKDPADHVEYLKVSPIKGVGFSGGEPFLVLDRLLGHVKAIRKEFGNSIYLWAYTNGDKVTRAALKSLREAGLDEIRFDLSARHYDLSPLAFAKEYIPTVTVEIPAIPEDLDRVKGLLGRFEALGVKHLNLHQLHASRRNYKALVRRGYHFLHQPTIAVFESEICALELLKFARERRVKLPINYCATAYKSRIQHRGMMQRKARPFLRGFEEITDAGYLRTIQVADSSGKIGSMVRRLQKAQCAADSWKCNDKKTEVAIHSSLLPYVDWSSADVTLVYFAPQVGLKKPSEGISKDNLVAANHEVCKRTGWSKAAIECWRKLYIEKEDPEKTLAAFFQKYSLQGGDSLSKLTDEMSAMKSVGAYEQFEDGLPEIL